MDLKKLQQEAENIINAVDNKLSITHTDNISIMHLTEEIGEIVRQINNKNIRKVEQDMENLEEEIADVILLTTKLANNNNIDIEKAITTKIDKLKDRHNLI